MSQILISKPQLQLIIKTISITPDLSADEKEEIEALIDCFKEIIEETDEELLHDLEMGSLI